MPPDRPQTLLGFDFGLKRIGVAVGQTLTASASPLAALRAVENRTDWDGIAALIAEWRPDALIVGLPYDLDGGEQEMTRAARNFGRRLEGRFHLPVHFIDEHLSSVEAKRRYAESGRSWRGKKARDAAAVDQIAAQIIVETWLQENA